MLAENAEGEDADWGCVAERGACQLLLAVDAERRLVPLQEAAVHSEDFIDLLGQGRVGEKLADRLDELGSVATGSLGHRCMDDRRPESVMPVQVPGIRSEVVLQENRHTSQGQGGEPRAGLMVVAGSVEQSGRCQVSHSLIMRMERGVPGSQGIFLRRLRQHQLAVDVGDVQHREDRMAHGVPVPPVHLGLVQLAQCRQSLAALVQGHRALAAPAGGRCLAGLTAGGLVQP